MVIEKETLKLSRKSYNLDKFKSSKKKYQVGQALV